VNRTREQLVTQVGAEIGALFAGARAVTNRAAAAFAQDQPGLRPAAFHVARWLHSFGPARSTEIARSLGMDKAAVSRLVAELVSAGIAEKRDHPDDARSLAVALTRVGEKRLTRVLAAKGAELAHRLEAFEDGELTTLALLLHRLNER
jgi:DNA-binding MarR family transcriptional regulator